LGGVTQRNLSFAAAFQRNHKEEKTGRGGPITKITEGGESLREVLYKRQPQRREVPFQKGEKDEVGDWKREASA